MVNGRRWLYIFFFALIALAIVDGVAIYLHVKGWEQDNAQETPVLENEPIDEAPAPTLPSPIELPSEVSLTVPFTSQSPFANWDELHEEACEEASLLMVRKYMEGIRTVPDPTEVENDLQAFIAWQGSNGYSPDVTLRELAQAAERYYGLKGARIISDPTIEDIKRELANERPVIMPAAGRLLGNPYFTPPGPDYHMIVIKGYSAEGFITNDPGTRRGESIVYKYDVLMNAIADWDTRGIEYGKKAVMVYGG